jgi:xylulose-5-phosphate/fructose-6-phosphate phosphoketolase
VPHLGARAAYAKQAIRDKLLEHEQYIHEYGEDMPAIGGWQWGRHGRVAGRAGSTESDNV